MQKNVPSDYRCRGRDPFDCGRPQRMLLALADRQWQCQWHPRGVKLTCIARPQPYPRATARVHPYHTRTRLPSHRRIVGAYPCGRPIGVKLSSHNSTPGRPQGSHPLILTTPALTKTTKRALARTCLCKGGCGVKRSGDPCGRPGVELWLLNLTPIGRDKSGPYGHSAQKSYAHLLHNARIN